MCIATVPDEPSCQYHDAPHRVITDEYLEYGRHHIVEDDDLTLGCEHGYKLNGDADVYCDVGGVWDPPLPQCEGRSITAHPNMVSK